MEAITHKIYTYYQAIKQSMRSKEMYWELGETSNSKIRESPGFPASSFRDLVGITAKICVNNKKYDIFYRGQKSDYLDKYGKSVIYPQICRPDLHPSGKPKKAVRTSTIEKRYNLLKSYVNYRPPSRFKFKEREIVFPEHKYALIQHYELLPTPLIDVTQSLRVAATFALKESDIGYLYIIGLPYPNGSISHFIDSHIVLVKLQNVCPPNALRPRYQEGFLVGRIPFYPEKEAGDNLARRILGKILLDNSKGTFWDKAFNPVPDELLFPAENEWEVKMKKSFNTFRSSYHPGS